MPKDPQVFIQHILLSIDAILRYTNGVNKEEFLNNEEKSDACMRQLEIIGEAIKNLPNTVRKLAPNVRWKSIAGLRDMLIHQYSGIDIETIWNVIENDLFQLKQEMEELQKKL